MKSTTPISMAAVVAAGLFLAIPAAVAGEEHGHCSGANVCAGDAACEKQGWKETTKDECAKIEGAKFAESSHEGEEHKDAAHDHEKK